MRNLITFRENLIEPFKLKPISIQAIWYLC